VPRKARIFVAGATYHVYCRVARGERPFAEEAVAGAFVATVETVKREHGLTILAWCLMPNHYHLVIRAGELPLWRSMRLVQGRFARAFNRRRRVFGPLWQGRYKARLVDDPGYLMQAIAYVHLNPVASRMVKDPGAYRWSGHRQVLGRVRAGLVDVDEALVVFGSSRREALVTYRGVLGRGRDEGWMQEGPGRLPWWRRASGEDEELRQDPRRPRLDWQGVVQRPAPPKANAAAVARAVATVVDIPVEALGGRGRGEELQRARELVMLVGVERCGLKVKDLAAVIGRGAGSASRLYAEAAAVRRTDSGFATTAERVTGALRKSARKSSERQ
jgi:REP element-mobilizing transposase RayT